MSVVFKVDGLDAIRDALKSAPDNIAKELRVEWQKIGRDIQKDARLVHGFTSRSGDLARSVNYKVEQDAKSLELYLDSGTANYGKYIHDGFKSWKADPFLSQAFSRIAPEMADRLIKAFRRAIAL